ncbi:hypothetical protein OUZ56_030052 [Daphnia magna]|uniref:Uncharacterized protein n=1 Tax=Daphnia magna TaxID=35525 RepID=A0ABQ9ZQ58_9CRUS|nr:hypothetical protein OUZ56_030052 [Daphnia magna]
MKQNFSFCFFFNIRNEDLGIIFEKQTMLQHLPTLLEGPLSWQKKKTKKCLRHLVLKIKTKSALSVALTILPAVLDRYSALESAINGHAKLLGATCPVGMGNLPRRRVCLILMKSKGLRRI